MRGGFLACMHANDRTTSGNPRVFEEEKRCDMHALGHPILPETEESFTRQGDQRDDVSVDGLPVVATE